jgi:hypothetical protein
VSVVQEVSLLRIGLKFFRFYFFLGVVGVGGEIASSHIGKYEGDSLLGYCAV